MSDLLEVLRLVRLENWQLDWPMPDMAHKFDIVWAIDIKMAEIGLLVHMVAYEHMFQDGHGDGQ